MHQPPQSRAEEREIGANPTRFLVHPWDKTWKKKKKKKDASLLSNRLPLHFSSVLNSEQASIGGTIT